MKERLRLQADCLIKRAAARQRQWLGCLAFLALSWMTPAQAGNSFSCRPTPLPLVQPLENLRIDAISADGLHIIFTSSSNPVGLNPGRVRQIFHYDILQGALSQVSRFTLGQSILAPVQADADLKRVVFATTSDLTGGNADGSSEIFLIEVSSGQLSQLTSAPAAPGANGSFRPAISGDGSRVAFISDDNLAGANGDFSQEVFLLTLESGHLAQLSLGFINHLWGVPSLSQDGTRLVATRNDITGEPRTRIVLFEVGSGLARSLVRADRISDPSISQDGKKVTFLSNGDLSGGNPDRSLEVFTVTTDDPDSGANPNVFGKLEQITHAAFSPEGSMGLPVFNADASRIFFPSSLDWTGQNPTLQRQIYLYDAGQRSLSQVTRDARDVLTSRLPINSTGQRLAYVILSGPASDPQAIRLPLWSSCNLQRQPVLIFPQIVSGGGFESELILSNPESSPDEGTVLFLNNDGSEMGLVIDGQRRSRVPYHLAPGGTLKLQPVGEGELRAGYVTVVSDAADSRLTGNLIYLWNGQEVSVSGSRLSKEYHVFTEKTQQTATGVALVNAGQRPLPVKLTLLDGQGQFFDEQEITLGGAEQMAKMLDELFPQIVAPFNGSLHARADDNLAMLGLRLRGSSLAALGSSPTAFPNSGSQILYLLDTGLDLTRMGFSPEELENSTVHELTGMSESPNLHLLELLNTHDTRSVSVIFRYFNERCESVLQFLAVINCRQSMTFDPFNLVPSQTGLSTREAFFGSQPDSMPLTGSQFGTGRFVLSVTAVGHSVNADEQADILFPFGLDNELTCGPMPGQAGAAPGVRNSNLQPCNADYMSYDYLTGRQIFSPSDSCQGPLWVADEQLLASTRQARQLVDSTVEGQQCRVPPTVASCPMAEALSELGTTSCQGRLVGPAAIVKIPQPTFSLLP